MRRIINELCCDFMPTFRLMLCYLVLHLKLSMFCFQGCQVVDEKLPVALKFKGVPLMFCLVLMTFLKRQKQKILVIKRNDP